MSSSPIHGIIEQVIALVPKGKVATYGQIAKLAGYPNHSRMVGNILKKPSKTFELPWYRIINSQGIISFAMGSEKFEKQKELLEKEGIVVTQGKIALALYQWDENH